MQKKFFIKTLNSFEIGEPVKTANLEMIPLFNTLKSKTKYITLKEGLEKETLEIVEKNNSGTVAELRVINKGNKRVLLLDGEELAGAKQNRILNTTILLKKYSDTLIPVSCTEAGRWHYKTRKFYDSDVMAIPELREKKTASVSFSLSSNDDFHSNQREIWNEVNYMLDDYAVGSSPTQAMKDAYREKEKDVENYLKEINSQKNQQGFIIVINNKIVGMDYLSSSAAFKKLFAKLLKSYAMQAIKKVEKTKPIPKQQINSFINNIKQVEISKFKSPGHGYDLRISGNNINGNALQYRKEIIHLAVFIATKKDKNNFII